jgi:hypothetical protein
MGNTVAGSAVMTDQQMADIILSHLEMCWENLSGAYIPELMRLIGPQAEGDCSMERVNCIFWEGMSVRFLRVLQTLVEDRAIHMNTLNTRGGKASYMLRYLPDGGLCRISMSKDTPDHKRKWIPVAYTKRRWLPVILLRVPQSLLCASCAEHTANATELHAHHPHHGSVR